MTNEELKKKIAQIIADYFCPQRNEHKNLWGDDRLCYSKMNFAECERVTECTDALIAAGIGDVKDLKVQVNSLEITNIALQAGYDDAEKDRLYWVDKYKEAEHRAEVAEKAGRIIQRDMARVFDISNPRICELIANIWDLAKKQAEKEFVEDRKDD